MPKGLQKKGIIRRNKMMISAIELFLKNGYEKTTTANIAKAAGMAPSSFFAAFESKETLLLELVKIMFDNQFNSATQLIGEETDLVLLYGMETAIQLYIAEESEPLRNLYVAAYSLPSTSEYIYNSMTEKLAFIFKEFLPNVDTKDFYEMEIASSGITRAFMAKHCNMYFTIERKIKRYLRSCLTLYSVPVEKQNEIIDAVLQIDLATIAKKIIKEMAEKTEKEIGTFLGE